MQRKIYFIQPTYRDANGRLLAGQSLFYNSLALPALSATIPAGWEKEFFFEYFAGVDYDTDASVIGISSMGYDILWRCSGLAAPCAKAPGAFDV